jgi:hypothetical protein
LRKKTTELAVAYVDERRELLPRYEYRLVGKQNNQKKTFTQIA